MIHGVGVDICDNMRIQKVLERYQEKFLNRIFIEQEIRYCLNKNNPAPYLAARFAFKEAFFKALNPAFNISFHDIGLVGDEGKKGVYKSEYLNSILDNKTINNIQYSISHERHYSIAMVTLEIC